MILKNIQRISEGKLSTGHSHAKKNLSQFLGAPLVLPRIAYEALGILKYLHPPPTKKESIPFLLRPHKLSAAKVASKKREMESSENEPPPPKKMWGSISIGTHAT